MNKTIYWFRKNLRIQDNPSLQKAIKDNEEVICVYFVDYSINNPYGIEPVSYTHLTLPTTPYV